MTEEQIEQLLTDAGLDDVMSVYRSAIEIHNYEKIDGKWADGYGALSQLITHVRNAALEEAKDAIRNRAKHTNEYLDGATMVECISAVHKLKSE